MIALAVKHTFYHCARRLIAKQAECTFALLRYSLGGDRPSQTAQQKLSAARLTGILRRLPAILHKIYHSPVSAYSKGSRGLSVLVRVRGIFTTTTISPGH